MNTKKLALALFPLILTLVSCMNMNSSNGKEGAIRVALPGSSSRGSITLSKDNAIYTVSLMQDDEQVKEPQTGSAGGGDIAFDNLEPGTYTVEVSARQPDGAFLSKGSQNVKVTAGETASCSITLILAGNNGKVFSSNYYVLRETYGSSYNAEFFDNVSSTTNISIMNPDDAFEDINGDKYYININDVSSPSTGLAFEILKNNTSTANYTITIEGASKKFEDSLYYDPVNDSLWIGAMSSSNEYYFAKDINKLEYDETFSEKTEIPTYYPGEITAFAISGNDIYIASPLDNGASNLIRGVIEGSNDDGFTITTSDLPMSTQDMGTGGTITDILIHYDGYVYALVSQTGSQNFTDMYMVNNLNSGSTETTVYSRGAVVRLEPTSNGFKVSEKTGWTESSRIIASSNKDKNTFTDSDKNTYTYYDVNAYIPNYSERNSHFYGPRRFVAIKPKELAIADCGANIVMPDYGSQKRGKLFKHNRIVKVDLYKFALESNSVTDLNNINFSNLTLSGTIESVTNFTNLTDGDEK